MNRMNAVWQTSVRQFHFYYICVLLVNFDQKLDFKIHKSKGMVRSFYIFNFTVLSCFSALADHSFP